MARTLSGPLASHLTARAFVPVDLYEIVLGGTTYRYTTHGSNVTGVAPAAVTTYIPGVMQAQGQRQAAGLIADDLEVLVFGCLNTIGGKAWAACALDGDLDGATFVRYEGFLDPTTGLLVGCVLAFQGDISEVEPSSTMVRLVCSVPAKRFDTAFPGVSCQPGCAWDFASAACGYVGTLDFTATLAASSTASVLRVTTLPGGLPGTVPGAGFSQGAAKVAGIWRYISIFDNSTAPPYLFTVAPPFPAGVVEAAIGSAGALTLRLGCDKTAVTCDGAAWGYNRLASFLGAPLAPGNGVAK